MNETNTQISYIETLKAAGLSAEQALIYEYLLKNGKSPAGKLAIRTPLKRGLIYKVLDQLVELGLVIKHDLPGKIAQFEPSHPNKLQEIAEAKEKAAKAAQNTLAGTLPDLASIFNLATGKPGVRIYEGLAGIEKVYEIILARAKPLKIFASYIDRENPELTKVIDYQIKRQYQKGITTKALSDKADMSLSPEVKLSLSKLGIELKNLSNFSLPGQIIIFDDCVAISALSPFPNLLTTFIESKPITQTIEIIFDQLWSQATPV